MTARSNTPVGFACGSSTRNNVISYLEEHHASIPNRSAFIIPAAAGSRAELKTIPFSVLEEEIARAANGLLELGIAAGDRVVVFLPMSAELYVAMFAVQRIGAIVVFLDSWARRNHLSASARKAAPKAVISFPEAFDIISGMPEFERLEIRISSAPHSNATALWGELKAGPKRAPLAAVDPETTALITFTTGSSGVPKGANRTHRFLSAQHLALASVIPYESGDKDLPVFPIFCLNNLASGVTTVLPAIDLARPSAQDAETLALQIREESVSCTTLSPSLFNNLAEFALDNDIALPTLRRVVTGGAPVSSDDVKRFLQVAPRAVPLVLYGSTEVEPISHITAQEMLAVKTAASNGVNVGRVHVALRSKFIRLIRGPVTFSSWEALEVPPGEPGEFVVSGPHVCESYFNDDEAFARAKIRDQDGTVWHRTGDVGSLDADGNLWLVGRVHNAILRDREALFPIQAEILLKRLPGVVRAAYVGLPDRERGEIAACAILLEDESRTKETVKELSSAFKDKHLPVDAVYVLSEFPLDPRHHSKVEYEALREKIIADAPRNWLAGE